MQYVSGMERHIAPRAQRASTLAVDVNRSVGDLHIRFLDRDDHVTFTSHLSAVAGGRAGAREGYATLRDAIAALGEATAGDLPAAVVIERAGRFHGHVLKARDLEQGFRAPLRALHLEPDERIAVMELRATDRLDRVRALVDGDWVRRFRAQR